MCDRKKKDSIQTKDKSLMMHHTYTLVRWLCSIRDTIEKVSSKGFRIQVL